MINGFTLHDTTTAPAASTGILDSVECASDPGRSGPMLEASRIQTAQP